MPIDPQIERLMIMIGSGGGTIPRSTAERRAAFRSLMRLSKPEGDPGRVEDRAVQTPAWTVPLRIYRPARMESGAMAGLIYCHGGGMVAGGLDTHDALCRTLCHSVGCVLLAVDYRLAPEHRFPAAIEDACAATRWILREAAALGLDPARIAIAGDSAGGTLAAVVTQMLRDEAPPKLCAQFLLCPVLDAIGESASRQTFAQGFLLDKSLMQRDLVDYIEGAEALDDPRLSPLHAADVTALPPAFIHTAEFDPLRDEGAAYATRLDAAGVAVRHTCHRGMIHHFYGFAALVPKARDALRVIAAEMTTALS